LGSANHKDEAEVRQHMLVVQSGRKKGYADSKRFSVEFQVDEEVLLRVLPTKGAIRINIKASVIRLKRIYNF
jgi:hypothetical protein